MGPLLTNGRYRTEAGSTVEISGQHAGIHTILFDWFEEGACCESSPSVDVCGGMLVWQCECCGSRNVPLARMTRAGGGPRGR